MPSGIWDAHEYDKLLSYDGSTAKQAMAGAFALFFCHTADGSLCAGWVGCHNMAENLAIRMTDENIDYDAVTQYQSPAPLFGSGAEAAEHGKREISNPSPAACAKIQRLLKQRCKDSDDPDLQEQVEDMDACPNNPRNGDPGFFGKNKHLDRR